MHAYIHTYIHTYPQGKVGEKGLVEAGAGGVVEGAAEQALALTV